MVLPCFLVSQIKYVIDYAIVADRSWPHVVTRRMRMDYVVPVQ